MKMNFILFLILLLPSQLFAQNSRILSLEEYLTQVKSVNQGYQGAVEGGLGASERAKEGALFFSPTFFTSYQYEDDRKPKTSSSFQGNKSVFNTFEVGINQRTRIGLTSTLSYNLIHTDISGVNSTLVPQSKFYDTNASLEIRQSLWRDGFGREVRNQEKAIEAQAKSDSFSDNYRASVTLADAEMRYWRLALAQSLVKVHKSSVGRAQSLLNLHKEREGQGLVDNGDVLQSSAALKMRNLDLRLAIEEEMQARRYFNAARNVNSDEVSEKLELPSLEEILAIELHREVEKRDDVIAAEENMKAIVARSKVSREQQLPNLDLVARLALNGKDADLGTSNSNSFSANNPTTIVGVQFSIPLDFKKTSSVRAGYLREMKAAKLDYQNKLLEQDVEWNDLSNRLNETKTRLEIADELVHAQSMKLNYERERRDKGRSTTYQVILFEQDYLSAQVTRLQSQADVLSVIAEMKTFRSSK